MKANELRIGNLVTIDNSKSWGELKHIPMFVTGIKEIEDNDYSISIVKAYEDDFWCSGFNQYNRFISPIILTEEWLIKFGFEKEENSEFVQFWNKGFISFYHEFYHDDNSLNKILFTQHTKYAYTSDDDLELKNVHQLQNLYFALTNEELTIN